ncbi:MAG TPA: ATP-binding protein [Candidatus Polarisedimenticolia bacterium]|nr:ATP-binding protein [Candidatus Polarisedimenticolia bacterium]
MDLRVQGYESQLKLFLVLLVLFLVAIGGVSVNALHRTRSLLLEEAEERIVAATRAAQREIDATHPAAAVLERAAGAHTAVSRLRDVGRANGIASLELVDRQGRVLAGTQPWRVGIVDPVAARAAIEGAGALSSGGAVVRQLDDVPDPGDEGGERPGETVVLVALRTSPSGALLRASHQGSAVALVAARIRLLSWIQALAGLAMLGLVLLFVRWVLRPYRALKAAAAQIGVPAQGHPGRGGDDPDDLVASFRGVIEKLKGQDAELATMRALAGGGAGALSQAVLDGLTSGVMIVGMDGRVTALNPAGESILGRPRGHLVGAPLRALFASSPELLALLEEGAASGRAAAREVVPYARAAGPAAHLGVTISPIPAGSPGGGGAFCIFSDLTEIRGLQERVRLKENLAGLGEMSAGIAHEFRNALATILGYARLIGRGGGEAGRAAEHAAAIAREVQGIGRVVDDFLRYARPAALQPRTWDPRGVVSEVAREAAREAGCGEDAFAVEGEWPAAITADEALMRQAFLNVLRNAFQAAGPGPRRVAIAGSVEAAGGQLRIEVRDRGPGIPAGVMERLFTPFVTTKEGGTGLGLAMAQKAVVCHDGAIAVGNHPSGGACVTITLPLQPAAARPAVLEAASSD